MSQVLTAVVSEDIKTAQLIDTMTPEQAAAQLCQCLILRKIGGKLPPLEVKLLPEYLGLPPEQSLAGKSLVKLGSMRLLPKRWANKLAKPRGRLSMWASHNCMQSVFGRLIPLGKWCPKDYVPGTVDFSSAPTFGIHTTFRECFDQAQWLLAQTVEEICDNYDKVVDEMHAESDRMASATYDQIIARFREEPDAYPHYKAVADSVLGLIPADLVTGQAITKEEFQNRQWNFVQLQIPHPDQIRDARVYYQVQAIPTQAYQPIGIAGYDTFDQDLKEAHDHKIEEFQSILAGIMQQVWEHVADVSSSLLETLKNTEGQFKSKMGNQLRGLVSYVESVNLTDDPYLEALAKELKPLAEKPNKENAQSVIAMLMEAQTLAKKQFDALAIKTMTRDVKTLGTVDIDVMTELTDYDEVVPTIVDREF